METYRSGHNEPDSKSGSPQGLVGSNPTVSATPERSPLCSGLFFVCDRNKPSNRSLAPPFSQKVSLGVLFSCKRPHDGSLSLPTFCELREVKSLLRKAENIFFIVLIQTKAPVKTGAFVLGTVSNFNVRWKSFLTLPRFPPFVKMQIRSISGAPLMLRILFVLRNVGCGREKWLI